jgi:hypothetical protein
LIYPANFELQPWIAVCKPPLLKIRASGMMPFNAANKIPRAGLEEPADCLMVGTLILQAHAKKNRAQLSITGIC